MAVLTRITTDSTLSVLSIEYPTFLCTTYAFDPPRSPLNERTIETHTGKGKRKPVHFSPIHRADMLSIYPSI